MIIMMIVNFAMEAFSIIISSIFDHTDCQKYFCIVNYFHNDTKNNTKNIT